MLPPVAEIYVVWHPHDPAGAYVANRMLQHFHGTSFTGLIGGGIEVYVRSVGWRRPGGAPRPIPLPGAPPQPNGPEEAQFVVVVPVLGTEFAAVVECGAGSWYEYAVDILDGYERSPTRVGIFPVVIDRAAIEGTRIGRILGRFQSIGAVPAATDPQPDMNLCCRDLAQGLTQLAHGEDGDRLTIFISHTKNETAAERELVSELITVTRSIINQTRLDDFFDTHDLQPGRDWSQALEQRAASSAMLAIRTDLYSSRTWCQREMLLAKHAGMPVVVLDALSRGDERGSFLMDHVPRVPIHRMDDSWRPDDVAAGLNLLVDECLKHALWGHQRRLAADRPDLGVAWWAPRAPEPLTLAEWLTKQRASGRLALTKPLRILHPDPPLGPDEVRVLDQLAALSGIETPLEIMTPRSLAARGG